MHFDCLHNNQYFQLKLRNIFHEGNYSCSSDIFSESSHLLDKLWHLLSITADPTILKTLNGSMPFYLVIANGSVVRWWPNTLSPTRPPSFKRWVNVIAT